MKRLGIVIAFATLCACSGGTGSSTPVTSKAPATESPVVSQATATGNATIFIPNAAKSSGTSRKRDWISPSTMLVDIDAAAADGYSADVKTLVTPSSPNCTGQTGGRSCTVAFAAIPGTDIFQVYAYDGTDEFNGNAVAAAVSTGVTVTSGAANTVSFVLGGIVGRSPVLSPTTFSVTQGTAQTLTLTITGEDVDGNPITLYDSPLTISQTDTSGTYTLSTTSIADSSVTPSITIAYNGGMASTTITVAAPSANTNEFFGPQSTSITITPH